MPTAEETAAAELLAAQLASLPPSDVTPPIMVPPPADLPIGYPHLHPPTPSIAPAPFPPGTHFAPAPALPPVAAAPREPMLVRDFAKSIQPDFVALTTTQQDRTWVSVSKIARLATIPPVASPIPQPMQIRIYTGDGAYVDVFATRELFEACSLPSPL